MDYLQNSINERLQKKEVIEKKQIVLSLSVNVINDLDAIANTFTRVSGINTARNMLIDEAIVAYIKMSKEAFAQNNIKMEGSEKTAECLDTVVYPGRIDGYKYAFLGEHKWYYVRAREDKIPNIKYVAVYVGAPESRITHYGEVDRYVYDNEHKGYVVHLKGAPIKLETQIPLGSAPSASVRAPRYTTLEKLLAANDYADL